MNMELAETLDFIKVNEQPVVCRGWTALPSPTWCECGGANVLIHSGHYRLRALMWDQHCECRSK